MSSVVDVKENQISKDLIIYPNPARDYIEIQSSEGARITIYNSIGEIVLSVQQTYSSFQRINVNTLVSGIYFIKVGYSVKKFVKM
jgi:hypothetical protein